MSLLKVVKVPVQVDDMLQHCMGHAGGSWNASNIAPTLLMYAHPICETHRQDDNSWQKDTGIALVPCNVRMPHS